MPGLIPRGDGHRDGQSSTTDRTSPTHDFARSQTSDAANSSTPHDFARSPSLSGTDQPGRRLETNGTLTPTEENARDGEHERTVNGRMASLLRDYLRSGNSERAIEFLNAIGDHLSSGDPERVSAFLDGEEARTSARSHNPHDAGSEQPEVDAGSGSNTFGQLNDSVIRFLGR
jgi:hypothetical protein